MVVPPLSALFTDSTWNERGDKCPLFGSVFLNKHHDQGILFWDPWPLDQLWMEDLLPSVEALYISPSLQALCNFLPILVIVFSYRNNKLSILPFSPVTFVGAILVLGWPSLVQTWVLSLSVADNFTHLFKVLLLVGLRNILEHEWADHILNRCKSIVIIQI